MAIAEPDNDQPEEPLPSLLLTGPTGTGKTHQAYGALRHIAESAPRRRYSVIAIPAADMYGELRPTGQAGAAEHRLRQLASVPLLLLDDLGSAKASEWTEEVTYRLINERYNTCLPTLFTSNLPPRADGRPDLAAALGDRIVSRLAEMTTVIDMRGADRRRAA
jgi:DNA replication protein DnaC